ncbi:MAG: toxin-antitoxin system HicB family antitoxin [Pseudomonadota bacterium]
MASPGKRAFLLRVRPEVLEAVERLAAAELRSVNAQLEVLLREALARRNAMKDREPDDR